MYIMFIIYYIVVFCMYIVYGHRIRVTGPLKLFLFPHQGGGVSMNVWSGRILWRGGGEGARGYFTKQRCAWLYRPNYSGTIQTDNNGRISVRRPIRPVNGMENWARGKKNVYIYWWNSRRKRDATAATTYPSPAARFLVLFFFSSNFLYLRPEGSKLITR